MTDPMLNEEVLLELVEQSRNRYYGKYRGFVADNRDPEQRGRLRLRCPTVLADLESGWALPAMPYGGLADQGMFLIPDVDAQVWVEFEAGDVNLPIWTGTFWQQSGDPPEEAAREEPTTRLVKTRSGIRLQFDDAEGEERVVLHHPTEAQLEIDPEGTVAITDAQGAHVTLNAEAGEITIEDANGNSLTMTATGTTVEDASGNKVEMAPAGVTVQGTQIVLDGSQVMLAGRGGEPIIKGQSFLTLFMTHVHPTGVGPSGPPIPQGEMSTLSTKVLTS